MAHLQMILLRLLRNRNFILTLSFLLGLLLGSKVAHFTKPLTLPALALVMTVSATQISSRAVLPLRGLVRPILLAVLFNYLIHSTVILVLAKWLMPSPELWTGSVILAAAPPGVAVIPFTYLLGGDPTFSLIGTFGTYVVALALMPVMARVILGGSVLSPLRLLPILVELVILPLLLSRLLLWLNLARHLEKRRGTIVNWGFFLVTFTVVGLNREVFLGQPEVLIRTSIVGILSIFGLGYLLEFALKRLGVSRTARVGFTLMGTVKNSGFAAATALALFSEKASVPGTVISVFIVLYLIWIGMHAEQGKE
jgi:BASS family bile acid:Na+ symporter